MGGGKCNGFTYYLIISLINFALINYQNFSFPVCSVSLITFTSPLYSLRKIMYNEKNWSVCYEEDYCFEL